MTPPYRIRRSGKWWKLSRHNGAEYAHVSSFAHWSEAIDWANRLAIGLRSHP